MPANTKKITRKTPCESCKHTVKRIERGESTTEYIWCMGCGEWEVVNGKVRRPFRWDGWIR